MLTPSTNSGNTISGTIGGTLLVLFNLHLEDITKTAILAGTGAIVSFLVSYGLSALTRQFDGRKTGKQRV
jgi:hypothetical protein